MNWWKLLPFFNLKMCYHKTAEVSSKMCSIVKVSDPDAACIAAECLKKGLVIALPTDTLYGLACDANNITAINHLYGIKKRDSNKPLAICVSRIEDIPMWANINSVPFDLLSELLPGPVSLIFERSKRLNSGLNPNIVNVSVRIPDYKFIKQVLNYVSSPLALTSANQSNEPSTLSIEEFQKLWPHLPFVFDGGVIPNPDRCGSTIIDLSEKGQYSVVRKGVAFDKILTILHKYNFVEKNILASS